MKNLSVILVSISILSCREGKDETKEHAAQNDEIEYRGEKLSSYPKVPLVQSIYDVSSAALDQKWSRQTWVIRFGEPSSNQLLSNGSEIIRYADYGPYQPPPAKNFLSGVNIRLDNGKTAKITYDHTSGFE